MNDLSLFGVLGLLVIRCIGFFIALDYWLQRKSQSHTLYLLGLGAWIMAGVIPILNDTISDPFLKELLVVTNSGLSGLSFVLFMSGFLSYYKLISPRSIFLCSLIALFSPGLIRFGHENRVFYIFLLIQYCIILGLIGLGVFYRKMIQIQAKNSMKWYYGLSVNYIFISLLLITLAVRGESYGLYYSSDVPLIIFNYLVGISLTVLMIIFMVHLENDQNTYLMWELKDKYSHDLGNALQKLLSATLLLESTKLSPEKRTEVIDIMKTGCTEAGELISEIRELEG